MPFEPSFTPPPASFDDDIPPIASEPPSEVGSFVSWRGREVQSRELVYGRHSSCMEKRARRLCDAWSKRMYKTSVFEHSDLTFWDNIR